TQITLANVEAATPQQLGILGLTKGATTPSQAYLSMVRVGVPARRAWQMVRSKYPQWGKGFFRPKADAAVEPAASRAGMYPTSIRGKIIGVPNQGSHTLYGNWQSDNAVDIAVPTGTPIYAMWSGTIGPRIGPFKSGDPHLQGSRLTLIGQSDQAYYAHLSKVVVRPGQKVRAGQLLGYSGSANGVQHLHWATENRDPRSYLSESPASTVPPPINRRGSSTVPAAQISLAQKYGAQYGVDPRVLLAIAGHETQWGTTGAGRRGYTLGFGVTDSVTLSRYRGVENQYRHAAQLLAKWGVRTIDDIMGGKAASYATDPGWEQGVYSVYSGLV
ncbi:MAG TPA: peptidoglycan DD-metalloendopeptidase family protein, partial [Streptosporangiaceae bacterium]